MFLKIVEKKKVKGGGKAIVGVVRNATQQGK